MANGSGDKTVPAQSGGKPSAPGGKTNEEMLALGRNLAKVANQKRG
jgi:hypothetical protein